MTPTDERRPWQDADRTSIQLTVVNDIPRCGCCGGRLTRSCTICAGWPDPGVSIETIARGVAQVDRATQ